MTISEMDMYGVESATNPAIHYRLETRNVSLDRILTWLITDKIKKMQKCPESGLYISGFDVGCYCLC
jgi:hypothetical protein